MTMLRSMGTALPACLALTVWGCGRPGLETAYVHLRVEGVTTPVTFNPNEVKLPRDARVIGVVVDGRPRAYLVDALSMPKGHTFDPAVSDVRLQLLGRHVVNDFLNGVPVSVTYCDRNECSRVFTAEQSDALDLEVAGWQGNSMQLQWQSTTFAQDVEAAPLQTHSFEVTTWGAWCSEFPQTDVYVGHMAESVVIGYGHMRS